ncbi:LuxR C-terminal-related transcriptional regulator [Sphingomonas arenae]|uniref:LuxR C-terminal-related transcriptional regulator n=1 Tax=Sphingomonas arenae TaxID=2812555 RepID=UPI001967EB94|nr:response regulator transcription factor [Sphingomonas arenae]
MPLQIDVALVGRNTIVREGLQRILSENDFSVRWSAARTVDLPDIRRDDPWLLLLFADSDDAAGDGDSIHELHRRFPSARIVLLASEFDFAQVRTAFKAGVCGCLVDEIACDRLLGLLHLVALGEKVFPSQLADELVDHAAASHPMATAPTINSANLSCREVEILRCLIMGLPNKVISRRLSISEATVKVHVKAVLRKLQVMNRTQAAIWATSRGLRGLDNDEPLPPSAMHAALAATSGLDHGNSPAREPLPTA